MKKRLTAVLTAMFIILAGVPNAYAEDNTLYVTIDAQVKRSGNAYYEGEMPTFSITLGNKLSLAVDAALKYIVTNDAGEIVESSSHTVALGGRQKRLIGFVPDFGNKFGIYTISATLSYENYIATDEFKFSYTKKPDVMADDLGIVCHFSKSPTRGGRFAHIEDSAEILKESGAGWVRDEIKWYDVEKVKGEYEIPAHYDEYVNGAIAAGKKVMLLITSGNTLYETGVGANGEAIGCLPVTAEGIEGFANFAAFVAEHFKGRVDTFEIWNEPEGVVFNGHYDWLPAENSSGYSTLFSNSADAYANLIKEVYPAIKNVYKGEEDKVTVVSGGCTPVKSDDGYLYKMLNKEGVQNYIDAVAVHPYSANAAPADMYAENSDDFVKQMERVKSYTDKPIYITEYGASSYAENDGYDGVTGFRGYGVLGINGQALALVRAYMVAASDPQIERLFIYNFKEKGDIPSIEDNFGIIDYDYTPKRAYAAIANMSTLLGNAEPAEQIDANVTNYDDGKCARAYEFADKTSGDEIFVVAAEGNDFEEKIDLTITETLDPESGDASAVIDNEKKAMTINAYSGGNVKVLDILGNEIQPTDGVYPISPVPMYVVCSKPEPISVINGTIVKVSGRSAEAYAEVTALVLKKNALGQSVAYINQLRADRTGRYEFSFNKTNGDIYDIRIYDGKKYANERCDTEKYDIDIKYYVDGAELSDISEIKTGSTVKVEMEIEDKVGTGDNLIAYGCVAGNNAVLLEVDSASTQWENNRAVLTTEIKITEESDVNTLRFMLWDMNMRPVFNKIQCE